MDIMFDKDHITEYDDVLFSLLERMNKLVFVNHDSVRIACPMLKKKTAHAVSNTQTGEFVCDLIYKYIKQDRSRQHKQNTKWSPAIRLGTKFLIPLDRFEYYCIAFGGGYTYLSINHKFSSWDANVGFLWYF